MSDISSGAIPKPATNPRERIHRRIYLLRRAAIVASVLGFAGVWNLVAHHSVGITARAGSAPAVQSNLPGASSSDDSGGFFGNGGGDGGSNGFGVGGGSGSNPVVGTGGS